MIHTNLSALQAQRSLSGTTQRVAASVEQLSSGLRVNGARDDAAGLAIASRMTADLRASSVLTRGVHDGISLLQVAEGGLERIQGALQRARELAVQAANGGLQSGDRGALDREYQQLMSDIDRIADSNEAFGIHLLKGTATPQLGTVPSITDIFPTSGTTVSLPSGIKPVAYLPVGALNVRIDIDAIGNDDDLQVFTRSGKHVLGTPLSDVVWAGNAVQTPADADQAVLLPANGFSAGASYDASALLSGASAFADPTASAGPLALNTSYNGMQIGYSGDGDYADGSINNGIVSGPARFESIQIDQVTEPLLIMVVGSGSFTASASWDAMPLATPNPPNAVRTGPIDIQVNPEAIGGADPVSVQQTPSDTATLGLSASALDPYSSAISALSALDAAIDQVSAYRATHGASGSHLDRSIDRLAGSAGNLEAARSRIVDADFAQATANLAGAQIKANSAQAMLAQANSVPQQVLNLLLNGVSSGGR